MKKKIVIVLVVWMLLFMAAYATNVESIQKMYNRNTLSANSLTNFISDIVPPINLGGGGSGEGIGGKGVSTFENLNNVEISETDKTRLIPNTSIMYKFIEPKFSIYEISVVGTQDENDVALRVELLKGMSTLIDKPAPGSVYKYQNTWIGSDNIKDVMIRFKVENSWIDSNGILATDTTTLKWNKDNKEWVKLDTSITNKDDIYTYFESKVEGMSQFAIVGIKEDIAEGNIPAETQTSAIETIQTETTDIPEEQKGIPNIGIVATFAVLSIAYILKRKTVK